MPTTYLLEAKYELVKLRRLPAYAIPTLMFPVMFYLIFGVAMSGSRLLGGRDVSRYLLGAYGAFGVIGASLFAFGVAIAVERGQGWLLLKRASPMPIGAYLFGKVVASMAFAAVIVILLAVCAVAFGGVHLAAAQWLLLFPLLVLGAIPFCAIGLALGYLGGPNSAPAIVNLVHLPAALISGLWIPMEMLPHGMQVIAPWLPQYHLGQLALTVIGAPADTRTIVHLSSLLMWTIVGVFAAAWAWRHDEGRTFG